MTIDGGDEVFGVGELAILLQGFELSGQFAGDLFERFGVEDLSRFEKKWRKLATPSNLSVK